jgi:hypothetical protein
MVASVSERRACQVVGLHRSSYRYTSTAKNQDALKLRIRDRGAARGSDRLSPIARAAEESPMIAVERSFSGERVAEILE